MKTKARHLKSVAVSCSLVNIWTFWSDVYWEKQQYNPKKAKFILHTPDTTILKIEHSLSTKYKSSKMMIDHTQSNLSDLKL